MSEDTRYVYGAGCMFSGPIQRVGTTQSGLPCCPHCKGVLFETDTEEKWWEMVRSYAQKTRDESYEPMWCWATGRCFATLESLRSAYALHLEASEQEATEHYLSASESCSHDAATCHCGQPWPCQEATDDDA